MFKIQYLIYVYIALCACMMLYNIAYTLYNRRTEKKVEKQKNSFIKKLRNQINLVESEIPLAVKHRKYLYNKLRWTNNLLLFEQILEEQTQKVKEKYIKEMQHVFYDLAIYYQKTDSIKKAYFAYIIGKYKIGDTTENNNIINTLFLFMKEEAMYCRYNTLKAMLQLGNIDNIIKILKEMKQGDYYYSVEMLFENLLSFDGNSKVLAEKMWQTFWKFNKNTQIVIIKFIRHVKLDYTEEFYELLQQQKIDNKIKVEIIRYYRENIFNKVVSLLIDITKLKEIHNRELVIEAARALSAYNIAEVKNALKELLKRNDWDIRMAASESLSILGTSYYELAEIFNGEDNVVRKILRYKIQSYNYTNMNPKIEVS